MSTSAHSSSAACDQELLGELLHSVSQPLTSLRCSLELSIEEMAEEQQHAVSAALQQTEAVIGMIRLMREYLEVPPVTPNSTTALAPVLQCVYDDLSTIAAVRNVRLRMAGTCSARLRIAAPALRRALQYLILPMIARQPPRSAISLFVGESPAGTVLRARGDRGFRNPEAATGNSPPTPDLAQETITRARLAIAVRVLETGGATLAFEDGIHGFVLRIPHQSRPAGNRP